MKAIKPKKIAGAGEGGGRAGPRLPSRGRGVQRFAELLDATEALLTEHSPDDIGLYQIAEKAGAPTASVYHFFPTKDAAFLALAQRYLQGFAKLTAGPIAPEALRGWQELMAFDQRQAMTFYNAHPPAMKILYGGYGSLEIRQADVHFTASVAADRYHRLDTLFHMPFVRAPELKFEVSLAIMDGIWALSYLRHGQITETYFQEALEASQAYCRLFLPPRIELRETYRQAVERGEAVNLPPLGDLTGS